MDRDDIYAFNEQWKDVENRYNPGIITLRRVKAPEGMIARIRFEMNLTGVKHPITGSITKFYVHRPNDNTVLRTDYIEGEVDILPDFPRSRPNVRFLNSQIPRHINVFRGGAMCIGNSDETVLSIMFDNIFRACIYDPDPSIANYASAADASAIEWQRAKEASREFPIVNPALLFRRTKVSLPPVRCVANQYNRAGLAPIRRG